MQLQKGVGLIEVLVALLLLSIGILGFSVMQLRALDSSIEASKRVQALNLAKDLNERIRANQDQLQPSQAQSSAINSILQVYLQAFSSSSPRAAPYQHCYANLAGCSQRQFAEEDVKQIRFRAEQLGMQIAFAKCTGSTMQRARYCVYVAWENTLPQEGSGQNDCTLNGRYVADSKCLVMESF